MKNRQITWEPIVYRPELPEGWEVIEQRGSVRSCQTSFIKWGKSHHNAEPKRYWVLFNEFNMNFYENEGVPRYSVYGGRDIPNGRLKKFNSLKDAEAYLFYLMNETDKSLEEINSKKTVDAYNKKISDIKTRLEKELNERTSNNSFI